jgi:hypothetical protein
MNVAENIAEGSLLGAEPVKTTRDLRQALAESKVQETLRSFGRAPEEVQVVGRAAQANVAGAVKQFNRQQKVLWDAWRKESAGIPLETPESDAFIAKVLGQEKTAILPNAGATAARKVAALLGEDLAEAAGPKTSYGSFAELAPSVQDAIMRSHPEMVARGAGAPPAPAMTAAEFHKVVSNLGTLVRSLEKAALSDPSKYKGQYGLAKQLYATAQDDLRASLGKASPKALAAYDNARAVTRLGNEKLFNDTIMAMVKEAPEKIVGSIVQPNNSTAIAAVREAVGPKAFRFVQNHAMRKLLEPDPVTREIDWAAVVRDLNKLGPDTLKALFPDGQAAQVQHVANLMNSLIRQRWGGTGKMAIGLSQAGIIGGLAFGAFPPGTAAVLFGPAVLGRIMTNPTALKWLTVGLQAKEGSQLAARAGSQLLTFMLTPTDEEKERWATEAPTEPPVDVEPSPP